MSRLSTEVPRTASWELTCETAESTLQPLFECEAPPARLYIESNSNSAFILARLRQDGLAVVGTRYPQPRALQKVREVIRDLAVHARSQGGFQPIIVSGFARGIDRAAHEAAIEFGLPTVAILGCGIRIPYPAHHAELRRAILEAPAGGALISEYEWSAQVYASQFLARNRLIAQWTRATWVAEAGLQSGAMNTASWARRADRDCFATPGFPGDPSLAGNELLMVLHHATPLWAVHSLGRTWMELASLGPNRSVTRSAEVRRGKKKAPHRDPTWDDLTHELFDTIQTRQKAASGTDIVSLLDWSTSRGHAPARFFEIYQRLLEQGEIEEGGDGVKITRRD